ncbi:glutamine-hydrolyzing GMP synthase [Pumilibacter intestinalis]|uniref:glutamine-hydrolyzing GMP synthase n=1 Tax=Pumilibacter intestinalis TaxID=2941511 RepID=UPI00203D7CD3|nr:glutamine-hydrolyzing GMP synthase [Pumilibacter intestinalis]
MKKQTVLVLDFGGQYNQLIARRVREQNVYCEVKSYKTPISEIRAMQPAGIIFTGGPKSVYLADSPRMDKEIFTLGVPILGICYGAQFLVYGLGGEIGAASAEAAAEFGRTDCEFDTGSPLFSKLKKKSVVWMSHNDYIKKLPSGFRSIAHSEKCPYGAIENAEKKFYGTQFHPEVNHTEQGFDMLGNFLKNVCGCNGDWTMESYAETATRELREKIGSGKALLALSGGVDSSVACKLLANAIGSQLTCIFVDHGLMRKNEGDEVEAAFKDSGVNFVRVNAGERFLGKLAGVSDPERKRKIIGEEFIRVFEEEAKKIGKVDFLAQGTIYPDVIESGLGDADVIKSHHNVGGLPDYVDFKEIVEPLRLLFKDEVRALGIALGLSDKLVWRQPFPGPGLAIRIIGDITPEKVAILQDADAIFREEIAAAKLDRSINQYFAVLTNMRSVGVMGDGRTYDYTLALRGVSTTDFMTADFSRIPYDVLEKVSVRIVNEVKHINRIVYDITSKPPATIEWE